MDTLIDGIAARANNDRAFFEALLNDPNSVIEGFDEIEKRISSAIDGMSPTVALKELMASPSNDHCYQTSCGLSSFIEP